MPNETNLHQMKHPGQQRAVCIGKNMHM